MTQTGIRTWQVKKPDFPIAIVIRARNLDACDAVVSAVQVVKGGALVAQLPVTLAADGALSSEGLTKTYGIKKPAQKPPSDLIQTITGWFGKDAPDNASYEITITSAKGDAVTTSIGVPSIDPGIANLAFQYR